MKITLNIDTATCIRCGKCVRICPAGIFEQESADSGIALEHIENCIKCGHCVGICPTASVIHSEFPPEKVHAIDRNLLPTPEQMMLICKARRSNRAFSSRPIPMDMLEQILEAAHRAPTASNMQQVEFTLITNPLKLQEITAVTMGIFHSMFKKIENILLKPIIKIAMPEAYKVLPRFKLLEEEHNRGEDPILRKATALLLIHTPEKSRFGCQDSNLAYQNGSLMAESLNVSQFYTGFLCMAIKLDKKQRINKLLGIDGTIHAGMALALPSFKFVNYIDKKEIKVNKICN